MFVVRTSLKDINFDFFVNINLVLKLFRKNNWLIFLYTFENLEENNFELIFLLLF